MWGQMFTNITLMKRESDGARPNFLHITRDIIRRTGPVSASISVKIFHEHRVWSALSRSLKEIEKIEKVRIRSKSSPEEADRLKNERIGALKAIANVVDKNHLRHEMLRNGFDFMPAVIFHPTIMTSNDPIWAYLKQTLQYVSECRTILTNEIDGIETEENQIQQSCNICFRDNIPETSVFKHKGCTFRACLKCWLELWSRMHDRSRCPHCRKKLGRELLSTFEGSESDYAEDFEDE